MAAESNSTGSSPDNTRTADSESSHTPTPEEWAEAQRAIKAKSEAAERLAKKLEAYEADKARSDEESAKKRGEFEELYAKEKSQREALEAETSSYRAMAEAELADVLKALPDEAKALIPEELPIATRLRLAKATTKLLAVNRPAGTVTASGSATNSQFGGFKSDMEWAAKDPKGFKKAKGLRPI